jgi:hypothetical protein
MAALVGAIILVLDWLFSTKFTNSRWQTAAYAAVTLLIGLSLNTARRSITRLIDSLFFRQRYWTKEQANALGDMIIRARSTAELYVPLTAGIAKAFSLASAALFERMNDGGFVRVAAFGWPTGTFWHILGDDALAQSVEENKQVGNVDLLPRHEPDAPVGVARPAAMIKVSIGKTVPAVLLLGTHDNGTALDPDEIRTIRKLAEDAAFIYSTGPTFEMDRVASSQLTVGATQLPASS